MLQRSVQVLKRVMTIQKFTLSKTIIDMALAQCLNELTVANSEGLLQYISLCQHINIPGSDNFY